MLVILFQEQTKDDVVFEDNKFVGFKRISFGEEFLQNGAKPVWLEIRRLVNNNELREVFVYNKDGTLRMTPKTNLPVSASNYPKEENNVVFVRGSGQNKAKCPQIINGIKMITQYLWIRGADLCEAINENEHF